jgi:uridine kinase
VNEAAEVLARTLGRPATLGTGRLICIDGPSGSGKSTLAAEIVSASGASVVHTDDLLPGWDGLDALPAVLADLLAPLAENRTGRSPRYDWILGRHVEDLVLEPAALVVLDGVGSGARALAPYTTTLVWLDGDPLVRRTRALERDGEYFRPWWEAWAASEAAYFATEGVQQRADLSFTRD